MDPWEDCHGNRMLNKKKEEEFRMMGGEVDIAGVKAKLPEVGYKRIKNEEVPIGYAEVRVNYCHRQKEDIESLKLKREAVVGGVAGGGLGAGAGAGAGAGIGAGVGAACGAVAGPIGVGVGAAVGAGIGGVIGVIAGGAVGAGAGIAGGKIAYEIKKK